MAAVGIAGGAAARHLVDLVDHEDRVAHAHAAQRLQERRAWRRRDGCAGGRGSPPRLANAAHHRPVNAIAVAIASPSDVPRPRRPRRSRGSRAVRVTATWLRTAEELDDALLGLLQPVVPAVERLLDLGGARSLHLPIVCARRARIQSR